MPAGMTEGLDTVSSASAGARPGPGSGSVAEARRRARGVFRELAGWYREHRDEELVDEIWEAVGRAGVLGHAVPAEHGGTGAGLAAVAAGVEELAAVGLASMRVVLTACDALAVARHGGEALRTHVLPKIAAGDAFCCLAVTEPDAGTNTFRTVTRAARDGEGFRIDGQKTYVSGADVADGMLLVARTTSLEECAERGLPKTAGLALFWLDPETPGITLEPLPTRGENQLRQFAVRLDGVEVPASHLVGEADEGVRVLLDLINPERLLISALMVGTARHCLEVGSEHARGRKVFGDDAIGAYQSIQHPLAEVWAREQAVRLLVDRGTAAFDAGESPRDVGLLANAAKLLSGELGRLALDGAMHALGGKGLDARYGLVHLIDGVQLLEVAPIGRGMLLNFIAEQALELPRSY